MDNLDKSLLQSLSLNARTSTSALARQLNVSRSTIQDRMNKLELRDIIQGYTVRLGREFSHRQIRAQVLISVLPKASGEVVAAMRRMTEVTALYAISGEYDLIAVISAETTDAIDRTLDAIGALEGVEGTNSSIILSTKFQR